MSEPRDPLPASRFADRLKASGAGSVDLINADWEALARALEDEPQDELEAAFHEVLAAAPTLDGAAAVAPAEALAIGVVAPDGAVEQADVAFAQWFGDGEGLKALVDQARAEGAALGLVEDADGEVAAAWAGHAKAAARWPLSDEARRALAAGRERLAVVVFAPSRSSALADRAADAFDLTAAEARLAQAILFAPSLEVAASQIGIGRETARDTLKRVMAKAGAKRIPALLARLTELMCGGGVGGPGDEAILVQAFGVTPSEARCAALIAAGETAKQAAETLGLSPETVKSYVKAVLAKTGLARAKDLGRLLVEARELATLATVLDPVFETASAGRLRVVAAPEERRIAFIDYGPRSAEPAFIFHGYAAGRTQPAAFVKALQARGFRPIVPQRPGYGLTTPHKGDAFAYVAQAAADLKLLADELKARDPVVLARDGGVAIATEFAHAYPGRINRFVLLNPRAPAIYDYKAVNVVDLFTRGLLGNVKLVVPVTELLRRHANSEMTEANLRRTCSYAPADVAALEDQATVDGLVRDIMALVARTASGFAAEHAIFAAGWTPPKVTTGRWTLLRSAGLPENPDSPWLNLPGLRRMEMADAGLLVQFTHSETMAEALRTA